MIELGPGETLQRSHCCHPSQYRGHVEDTSPDDQADDEADDGIEPGTLSHVIA